MTSLDDSPPKPTDYYWFMFTIALVLMLLYLGAVAHLCLEAVCTTEWCKELPPPGDGTFLAATTIGGLISALVVSVLAISESGLRANGLGIGSPSEFRRRAINLYLFAWIVAGCTAFVFGSWLGPESTPQLTDKLTKEAASLATTQATTLRDIGHTWLGTAVAAVYSYFGIRSPSRQQEPGS